MHMGKLKTKKAVAKRFQFTKRKKIKYLPGGKGHLLSHKTKKRKRQMRRARYVQNKQKRKYLRRMLAYG